MLLIVKIIICILILTAVSLSIALPIVLKQKETDEPDPPTVSLQNYLRDALATSRTRPLRIFTIGDSTVQGFGPQSSDFKVTSWPSQFARLAGNKFNKSFNINNAVGALFNNLIDNDSRVDYTGWAAENNGEIGSFGMGGASYLTRSTSPFSFTPSTAYDVVEIYVPATSVPLRLIIDGVATVLTTPDTARSNSVLSVYIHTLTSTNKTIQIQSTDATKDAKLAGIIAFSVNDAACVINCGVGGSSTNDWVSRASPTSLAATISCYAPDLVIQNLCINNYWHPIDFTHHGSGTTAAMFGDHLIDLDNIYANANAKVLYYTPNTCGTGIAPIEIQQQYVSVIRNMARARGRPLVDIFQLTESADNMLQKGWLDPSDGCHPTPSGYVYIADQILNAL